MEKSLGHNGKDLKRENKNLIFYLICTGKNLSRVALSKLTGLSKMTVSNIISELLSKDCIVETKALISASSGPKPICLAVSPKAPKLMGVAIRRGRIGIVTSRLDLTPIESEYIAYDGKATTRDIIDIIKSVIAQRLSKSKNYIGIGVVSPGPIDKENGIILNPPNLFDAANIRIVKQLSEEFGLPVTLEKDTDAAALAETHWGNTGTADFAYLAYASGIGAAIITQGKMLQPKFSSAGEIGHTSINFDGIPCGCGNKGCLEKYCASGAVVNAVNTTLGTNYTFTDCVDNFQNPRIKKIFYEKIDYLIIGLTNLLNTVNPSCIILGDRGYDFPDELTAYIEQEININKFSGKNNECKVIKSKFGHDGTLYGAAAIVANNLLFNM